MPLSRELVCFLCSTMVVMGPPQTVGTYCEVVYRPVTPWKLGCLDIWVDDRREFCQSDMGDENCAGFFLNFDLLRAKIMSKHVGDALRAHILQETCWELLYSCSGICCHSRHLETQQILGFRWVEAWLGKVSTPVQMESDRVSKWPCWAYGVIWTILTYSRAESSMNSSHSNDGLPLDINVDWVHPPSHPSIFVFLINLQFYYYYYHHHYLLCLFFPVILLSINNCFLLTSQSVCLFEKISRSDDGWQVGQTKADEWRESRSWQELWKRSWTTTFSF